MKILITGGHHTSALAVIEEFKKISPPIELLFVGHKYSMQKDKNVSAEFKDVQTLNIPFYDIRAGKFYGVKNPLNLLKIIRGFINALILLQKTKPQVILSFGGYIAVPVVIAGFILRIPSVTHEQTVVTGMSNRLISYFVNKIFISWESSRSQLKGKNLIYTGLPLRKEIFKVTSSCFEFDNDLPVVVITGGKQGSHLINECVFKSLPLLLEKVNVVHQCGSSSVHKDFEVASKINLVMKGKYIPRDYIPSDQMGELFSKASLMVGRSGAHFVSEFIALRKPSLLIPISWVSHNEQFLNAKMSKDAGLSEILDESGLTPDVLSNKILDMIENIEKYRLLNENNFPLNLDSAKVIADETIKTVQYN